MTQRLTGLDSKAVIKYVVDRQNDDGGYTFCQGGHSNAQDTFYGLSILQWLDAEFPNKAKTIKWLDQLEVDTIYSLFYVTKSKLLCGVDNDQFLKEQILTLGDPSNYIHSTDIFSEASSEFTPIAMALELARLFNIHTNDGKVADWILKFRNPHDGGFGSKGKSNITSTFYAIQSLSYLRYDLTSLSSALMFLRACEKPNGGFTAIPINFMPYVEYTYHGIMSLSLLGQQSKYPTQTMQFLLECQNGNGGFARSTLGISTFENTYQVVAIMRILSNEGN
ncbi:MAG: hypothetical protein NWE95_13120 [Candidatus Bathyarchaeota archaeon]|nr:hypothetical protein [Candidatus Bathyarchaeota archaeon]